MIRPLAVITFRYAREHVARPVEMDALTDCLHRARLRMRLGQVGETAEECLGESPSMRQVLAQLRQAARHLEATVLITGEGGTGKDVAARALHRLTFGEKAGQTPYVPLNCAAVPADMFEAELFGAERGAYAGAGRPKNPPRNRLARGFGDHRASVRFK